MTRGIEPPRHLPLLAVLLPIVVVPPGAYARRSEPSTLAALRITERIDVDGLLEELEGLTAVTLLDVRPHGITGTEWKDGADARQPVRDIGLVAGRLGHTHKLFVSYPKWLVTILAGGALALYATEEEKPGYVSRWLDRSFLEGGLDLGDAYGDGLFIGAGTLAVVAAGQLTNSFPLKALGADLARSLLMSGSVVWALKIGVGARRPDGGPYSFPSGHTAAAFSVAPILYRHLGPGIGLPAYILAGLTGLARMEDRRHYLADVVFGAALGIAAGQISATWSPLSHTRGTLRISPLGIAWHFEF